MLPGMAQSVLTVVTGLAAAAAASGNVAGLLSTLKFRNNGTVHASDVFVLVPQQSGSVATSSHFSLH